MAARSFLGAGDIFINRLVDGVSQGMVGPIKANRLEIQPQVEVKESVSKGRYDYGQVLESVNLAQPTEFTLELKEVTGDILVMAFMGTTAALNQAAGTLTNKAVIVSRLGRWLDLGVKNLDDLIAVTGAGTTLSAAFAMGVGSTSNPTSSAITVAPGTVDGVYTIEFTSATAFVVSAPGGASIGNGTLENEFVGGGLKFTLSAGSTAPIVGDEATVTVTATSGTVTFSEGVDYELNRPLGWIRALETGGIAQDTILSVDGSYKAATGTVISGSTRTEVRAHIVFDGINQADQNQCTVNIWEAVLAADSAFDFLADEFGNVWLTGRLKTPVGKTEPYTVTMQNPVV